MSGIPPVRTRSVDDGGFSLIELVITLLVLSVILVLTFTLLVGIQQQQQNQSATVNGARNAQIAEQQIVQYLQAAVSPDPGVNVPSGTQETATNLVLPAELGTSANAQGQAPPGVTTTLTASVVPCTGQCPPRVDELAVSFKGDGTPNGTLKIAAYYLLAPSTPLFTYEMYSDTKGDLAAMQMPVTQTACLQRIVAVKINASFLAGPVNARTLDGGAVVATTMRETVYVKNADLVYGAANPVLPLPAAGC
jgi:prepilin-type N-terminal cleavage/methylation domain-containing protein